MVETLRRTLQALPPQDDALRCRVMLSLAVELYYREDAARERSALVDEGLAVARRTGDPALRLWACVAACLALFMAVDAEHRVALATEALAAAGEAGDEPGRAIALTTRAIAEQESGLIDAMEADVAAARALCERLRLAFPLVVLGWLEVPWRALRGEVPAALELWRRTVDLQARTSMPQADVSPLGALLVVQLATGTLDQELLDGVARVRELYPLPSGGVMHGLLCRAGRLDEAEALDRAGIATGDRPLTWFDPLDLALAAEGAFRLGDADLAARVYARLAPYQGRTSCAGSGTALGPVDRVLALCAAATGQRDLAARHADDALALCRAWRIPVVEGWLAEERRVGGF
jgi:hypothetical protein